MEDYELIVVDGGSDDGTLDIIRANEDLIAHWVSEADEGIYDAWNKGVRAATGDWVGFLGADDYLSGRGVLGSMREALLSAPQEVVLVYGRVNYVRGGAVVGRKGAPWRSPWRFPDRFTRNSLTVAHPLAMHRSRVFRDHGLFDTRFRIAGDTEYLLRILRTGEAMFLPDVTTVNMAVGGVSSSPAHGRRLAEEIRRLRSRHGLPLGAGWYWFRFRGYVKRLAVKPNSPLMPLLWVNSRIRMHCFRRVEPEK